MYTFEDFADCLHSRRSVGGVFGQHGHYQLASLWCNILIQAADRMGPLGQMLLHGFFGIVHMKWRPEGKDVPETEMFTDNYVMRLEFGIMEKGKLPGKIYVCLSDKTKSFVGGSFIAEIK